jgi:hypothetical protein
MATPPSLKVLGGYLKRVISICNYVYLDAFTVMTGLCFLKNSWVLDYLARPAFSWVTSLEKAGFVARLP